MRRGRGKSGVAGEGGGANAQEPVRLRLYLADNAPASVEALNNLRACLEEVPPERYSLQIVDALALPAHALSDGVLLAPALVKEGEPPSVVTGTLADRARLLALLDRAVAAAGAEPAVEVRQRAMALARRVTSGQGELQALVGDGVDMVLGPDAIPVILPAAQKAVRDDARHFRRIFDAAPLGMALLSHDFAVLRANRRLSTLTGISPSELSKMGLYDLTGEDGDVAERLKLTGRRACETGFCEGETLFRKEDGAEVWLRLLLALVQHPGEGEAYFLLMVQDVTGIKEAEAQLVRYHGQLEELVRERTAELAAANRKLVKEIEERLEAEDAVRALNEELEIRVRERTAELEESNSQLEKMNRFFVGRELRMAELKREIEELQEEVRALKQERSN